MFPRADLLTILARYGGAAAFGNAVAGAGDVDGDGVGDIVVGQVNWRPGGQAQGRVFVYSGADGRMLHEFKGRRMGSALGRVVAGAGDVDRDGCDDIVFSSFDWEVEIRSGRSGALIHRFTGAPGFGCALDGGRDVDADGVPDIVVGAHDAVYVFSGMNGRTVCRACPALEEQTRAGRLRHTFVARTAPATACNRIELIEPAREATWPDLFGRAVSFVGDVDRDGHEDFAVGLPGAFDGAHGVGAVTVYSGAEGEALWSVFGCIPGGLFGSELAQLGDANGDGITELVVGAPDYQVVVLDGQTGDELSRACLRTGRLTGIGRSACGIGDLDCDGLPDLAVGSDEPVRDVEDWYQVQIYSSGDGAALYTLPELVPERLRIRDDEGMRDFRDGWTVVGAIGDVDGDGLDDYAVGLPMRGIVRVVSCLNQRDLFVLTPPDEEVMFE